MKTQCNLPKLSFQSQFRRSLEAQFDGVNITSDAGMLLLRELDLKMNVCPRFADCFDDFRDQRRCSHRLTELIRQRTFGLCLGYEDLNDHDYLRHDLMQVIATGKHVPSKPAAGKSTLNRLELGMNDKSGAQHRYKKICGDPDKVESFFIDLFISSHQTPPEEIVLDVDATDDPLHGQQEGRFFHGYYGGYCYLPLYIFSEGFPLWAQLRSSNIDASAGTTDALKKIVPKIRAAWPKTEIVLRGDSGFCRDEILSWCEDNDVDYIVGIARNARLVKRIQKTLEEAEKQFDETGKGRVFTEFTHNTLKGWKQPRRVIAKAEHLERGSNPRFLVTSLQGDPQFLYEEVYCQRGEMENRIKEQQLDLFADRTSTAMMRSNQLRLWFSTLAYALLHLLRIFALQGTSLAKAQCHTIRVRLLKLGAAIQVSCRRIFLSLSEAFPLKKDFTRAYLALCRLRL